MVQELEFVCPELLASIEMKVLPLPEGVGGEAQPKRHSVKIGWVTQLWCTQWLTALPSPPCMLVFVRPWKTEEFCSDKYFETKILSIQRREKKEQDVFLFSIPAFK